MLLVEEMKQIRENLVRNENRLAQLHADIYKRREEAREIRLSMPTPEYLDNVKINENTIEKMSKKKKKTLCSIHKLQENTKKDLEKYTRDNDWFYLKFLIVFILILLVFYLFRMFSIHGWNLFQGPSKAHH